MSLLSICQDASDEVGITQPPSIVGNSNGEVQKLYRCANKIGLRLMRVYPWQILRKEQTFTATATEEQAAALPSDFDRFSPETFWNRSTPRLIAGPIHAVQWQGIKAQTNYSNLDTPRFCHRGDSILFTPVPSAGDICAFEYVSKNWCQSSGAAEQARWAADTDTGIIDEELMTLGVVWEYLNAEGQPSGVAGRLYEECFQTLVENDQPDGNILVAGDIFGGGRHFTGAPIAGSVEGLNYGG